MIETGKPTILNFNAGPSILPKEVFEEASKAVIDFNNSGLSILEIGHRTSLFQEVVDEAINTAKSLMHLDDDHEVLFLHGGATTQFMQIPMNVLNEDETAAFTQTGVWANKAIKEAKNYGQVHIACSSEDLNYSYLPKELNTDTTHKYLHLTTNNTIYGTQWQYLDLFYETGLSLVADMSSDFLSRDIDFNRFDLIYAGAQKNAGAAGVTIVVINKKILGKTNRKIPSIMDYRNHIEAGSLLNTPPVFAIYVAMLTLRWLNNKGGLQVIEKENNEKAKLFYETLDAIPLFKGNVAKEDRSKMNACFTIPDPALEKEFLATCKNEGMIGIKGHRSAGGFRVSMYNALPLESVKTLTDLMTDFGHRKG